MSATDVHIAVSAESKDNHPHSLSLTCSSSNLRTLQASQAHISIQRRACRSLRWAVVASIGRLLLPALSACASNSNTKKRLPTYSRLMSSEGEVTRNFDGMSVLPRPGTSREKLLLTPRHMQSWVKGERRMRTVVEAL